MNLSSRSYTAIKTSIEEALEKCAAGVCHVLVTDVHLQPKRDTGELIVLNDDDEILSRINVQEWLDYKKDDFYGVVEATLHKILLDVQHLGLLDELPLMKPYSFVLIDEEKETVAELLMVDDLETMFLNDNLLKGLDEELDAFLKDLLEK